MQFNPSSPRASVGFLPGNNSEPLTFNSITPQEVASFNDTLRSCSIGPYKGLIEVLDSAFTSEGKLSNVYASSIIVSIATQQLILLFKTENKSEISVAECGACILQLALNTIVSKYPNYANFEQDCQPGEIENIVNAAFHQFQF